MIDVSKCRADLHIHTCYSDGQATPADIVKKANHLGYDVIAITDHDNFGGVAEAVKTGEAVGLTVLPGIELATETEDGIGLHILGYDMDIGHPHFAEVIDELAMRRDRRNEKLIAVLNDMGYELSLEELQRSQQGGFIGKPVIARALQEKGYIEDYRQAFRDGRFFGSPQARAVKKEKLQAAEAIALIREAGGVAVLAHPIQTRHVGDPGSEEFYDNMRRIIQALKAEGLGGIECYHPDQDEAQTKRFLEIARQEGLYVTRGSDFHGLDFADAEDTAQIVG